MSRKDARTQGREAAPEAPAVRIRLDKWLWFARFGRTRTLAATYVEEGRVRVDGRRTVDPAYRVRVGHVLTLALPGQTRVVEVLDTGERRQGAPAAALLYRDLTEPSDPP